MATDREILKYLEGKCTPEECKAIESWINSTEQNASYFNGIEAIYKASDDLKAYKTVDANQEWEAFKLKMSSNTSQETAKTIAINNKKTKSNNFLKYAVAASATILLASLLTFSQFFNKESVEISEAQAVKLETVTTLQQEKAITLSDNSIITLAPQSSIQYPSSFANETSREVNLLSGSANFNIASNPSKKFKLSCNEIGIEVLGTEFNVSTSTNNAISIDLMSGSLKAYQIANEENNVILNPGDKVNFVDASFVKEVVQPLEEREIKPPTPIAKTATLHYYLDDVLKFLDKKHGRKLKLDKRLKYDKVQEISLDINEPDVKTIISALEKVTSLKAKKGSCDDCYILTSEKK